jgi:hypothetical protein
LLYILILLALLGLDKLYYDLWVLVEVMDGVMRIKKMEEDKKRKMEEKEEESREYEEMIERLRELVEREGKREVARSLGIKENIKLLNKILSGCEDYPYFLLKRIKECVCEIK